MSEGDRVAALAPITDHVAGGLALLTQLRTKFKIDGFIYRVFPNGEVQYLHPKVSGGGGLGCV